MNVAQGNDFFVLGIDHRMANLDVRALYVFDATQRARIRQAVRVAGGNCVVLCTCYRTEIAASGIDVGQLVTVFADTVGCTTRQVDSHLWMVHGIHAMRHLMRVGAGLESRVIGEVEILGQLRRAIAETRLEAACGGIMDRVLRGTVHLARTAHATTAISRGAASISSAACTHIRRHIDANTSTILIIGAGAMARAVLENLRTTWPAERLCVVNRTQKHAERIAGAIRVVPWGERYEMAREADAVIIAVHGQSAILNRLDLSESAICVDLSVPRAVEPSRDRVIITVDDLQNDVDQTQQSRAIAAASVEQLIDHEIAGILQWQVARDRCVPESAA